MVFKVLWFLIFFNSSVMLYASDSLSEEQERLEIEAELNRMSDAEKMNVVLLERGYSRRMPQRLFHFIFIMDEQIKPALSNADYLSFENRYGAIADRAEILSRSINDELYNKARQAIIQERMSNDVNDVCRAIIKTRRTGLDWTGLHRVFNDLQKDMQSMIARNFSENNTTFVLLINLMRLDPQ